ncbi:MAG: helix-turn-helix transcriptional regulator [Pseudomonadota bacterium]
MAGLQLPDNELSALLPHLGAPYLVADRGERDTGSMKLIPPPREVEGFYAFHMLDDGMLTVVRKHVCAKDWHVVDYGIGRYSIQVQLEGCRRVTWQGAERILQGPVLSIFHQPRGTPKRIEWSGGVLERTVAVSVPADGRGPARSMPAAMAEALTNLAGDERRPFWIDLPASDDLTAVAHAIVDPPVTTAVSRAFRQAKAIELLCLAHDGLLQRDASERTRITPLTLRVLAMMDAAFPRELGVRELAAAQQVSTSTLSQQFRADKGSSLAAYQRDTKMRRAQRLLEGTHVSLKQIAYLMGYDHLGNFCTAYRRWSGKTPGEARRIAHRS